MERVAKAQPLSQAGDRIFSRNVRFLKSLELVTMYTLTDRTNTTALSAANTRSYQQFEGQLVRCQLQVTW